MQLHKWNKYQEKEKKKKWWWWKKTDGKKITKDEEKEEKEDQDIQVSAFFKLLLWLIWLKVVKSSFTEHKAICFAWQVNPFQPWMLREKYFPLNSLDNSVDLWHFIYDLASKLIVQLCGHWYL